MPLRWWCAVWLCVLETEFAGKPILPISSCRRWIIVFENCFLLIPRLIEHKSNFEASLGSTRAKHSSRNHTITDFSRTRRRGEKFSFALLLLGGKVEDRIANHPHIVASSAIYHEQLEWAYQRCQCIGGRVLPGRHQDDQSKACEQWFEQDRTP